MVVTKSSTPWILPLQSSSKQLNQASLILFVFDNEFIHLLLVGSRKYIYIFTGNISSILQLLQNYGDFMAGHRMADSTSILFTIRSPVAL